VLDRAAGTIEHHESALISLVGWVLRDQLRGQLVSEG
jgi:hypothetical protein